MGNFTNVTEIPGHGATKDQLSMMLTRYHLAKKYAKGKNVLEIACGSGTGLGYLAEDAESVIGGDIDKNLVEIASANYVGHKKVSVRYLDAQELPFEDNSFDLVLLYEAIYYIPDINKFVNESLRVTKPGGKILIASVNREWHGFNPSPFSQYYFSTSELLNLYKDKAVSKLLVGFIDLPKGNNFITSFIRKLAVSMGLIPKTMKRKEMLKRIFYGKLKPIPKVIDNNISTVANLLPFEDNASDIANYKQLYLIATVI